MLISVGWSPPYWCPSRRLLRSRLEGRGLVTRSKIAPKTGAASPPVARGPDQQGCAPDSLRVRYTATGTVRAIAHAHAAISRAIATTTSLTWLPRALNSRYRLHSRSWAFHAMARTSVGTFSRRSWRCRLTFAGYR